MTCKVKVSAGHRQGRLVVVSFVKRKNKRDYWLCQCDCGKQVTTACVGATRKTNISRSCGCITIDRHKARIIPGGAPSARIEYRSYSAMLMRCYKINCRGYRHYGARGITVCGRWRNSYQTFLEDMGERPSIEYTLERNDPNGNYEPSNCRWATWEDQHKNKRNSKRYLFRGEFISVKEIMEKIGKPAISKAALRNRLAAGWDAEIAVTTPRDDGFRSYRQPNLPRGKNGWYCKDAAK
jgi:hypothetical protein